MNKLVLAVGLVLSVIIVFGIVSAVRSNLNYPGTTTETEINEVTINIEKGWNLVHGFANPEWLVSGDISTDNIKAIYAFNPQNQEYVRFFPNSEDSKISKTNFRWDTYISQNSFWVYSNAKGRMTYKTFQFIPLEYTSLFKGWNFLGVTPYMIGKSLNDIKGDCNIEKAFGWEPVEKTWNNLLDERVLPEEAIGAGLVIKVSDDCKLGSSSLFDLDSPPSLPSDISQNPSSSEKFDFDYEENLYGYSAKSGNDYRSSCDLGICIKEGRIEYVNEDSTKAVHIIPFVVTSGEEEYKKYLKNYYKNYSNGFFYYYNEKEVAWFYDDDKVIGAQIYNYINNPDGSQTASKVSINLENPILKYFIDKYPPVSQETACVDSDGGLNYDIKGDVYINNKLISSDCCAEGGEVYNPNCVISSQYVSERFCEADGNMNTKIFTCANGCSNGACN